MTSRDKSVADLPDVIAHQKPVGRDFGLDERASPAVELGKPLSVDAVLEPVLRIPSVSERGPDGHGSECLELTIVREGWGDVVDHLRQRFPVANFIGVDARAAAVLALLVVNHPHGWASGATQGDDGVALALDQPLEGGARPRGAADCIDEGRCLRENTGRADCARQEKAKSEVEHRFTGGGL